VRRIALLGALAAAEDELGQALALLRVSGVDEPERLSIGEGDRRLLVLHRAAAGSDVELVVTCPHCGTVSSVELGPDDFPPPRPRTAWLGAGGGLREPTYGDLVGLPRSPGAVGELLRRCVVGSPPRTADPDDLELVDDSLSGPLVLSCSGCEATIESPVDVERAVLESLERHLQSIELEVHLLARAYHWRLGEIEELPDERRERLAAFVADGR
jgi:hypothetical protein